MMVIEGGALENLHHPLQNTGKQSQHSAAEALTLFAVETPYQGCPIHYAAFSG